jgi:GNAT superfamily N-acetyltransferase
MPVSITPVSGDAILPWLDALAWLRIQVFRDWPYLYDGTEAYERSYLKKYADSAHGLMVLAQDGDKVVGAASGLPMADADAEFQAPFVGGPMPLQDIFYFGESVLDAGYRGQGIGHRFFDEREAFARQNGFRYCTFCAVQRPSVHPRRPADGRDLAPFWRARGYTPIEGALTEFAWTDVGDEKQSVKPMQFWGKTL